MQMPSVSKEFWVFSGVILVVLVLGLCLQLFVFRNQEFMVEQDGKTGAPVEENKVSSVTLDSIPNEAVLRVDWIGYPEPVVTSSEYYQWIAQAKQRLYTAQPNIKEMSVERTNGEVSAPVPTLFQLGTVTSPSSLAGKPLLLINIPVFSPSSRVQALVPNPQTQSFTVVNIQRTEDLDEIMIADMGKSFALVGEPCLIEADSTTGEMYFTEYDDIVCTDVFTSEVRVAVEIDEVLQEIPHQNGAGTLRYMSTLGKEWFGLPYNVGGYVSGYTPEDESLMMDQILAPFTYQGRTVYTHRNGGHLVRRSDGAWLLYRFDPYFLSPTEGEHKDMYPVALSLNSQVEWLDGMERTNTYWPGLTYTFSGCGSMVNVTEDMIQFGPSGSNAPWFNETDLVPVAKTKRGEALYGFANPQTNIHVQALIIGTLGRYVDESDPASVQAALSELTAQEKQTFERMAKQPILFFWKDPQQNWRGYIDASIQSGAECGKPVIYLYPEQTTDVNVQVAPNGGFTETIPEYPMGGWNVKAEPNGTLTSYDDGEMYPYLFWEGHASGFGYPEQGFVFAKDGVESGMNDVLARFGMNEQETTDFLEFWLPKMVEKPYVFVTFADQRAFEAAAPLKITPKPDSVLRVFMYFELLDEPRTVAPLPIRPFVRSGFSVVEWGGVLQK